jgi:tRNA (cytidine/uridine-2'-O-)-methyltransferase
LVGPLGFNIDEKSLRRAGLDYWQHVNVRQWSSFEEFHQWFTETFPESELYFFTTKATKAYWHQTFTKGDALVFGRETKGLPESLLEEFSSNCLTIPIEKEARSLNLATSAGIALYEALRQTMG